MGPEVALAMGVDDSSRDPFGRTRAEREAAALPVLLRAHHLIRCGWVKGRFTATSPSGHLCYSLSAAVGTAGEGGIVAEYARRVLRRCAGTHALPEWEEHPFRTQRDVLALLELAITHCGGRVPGRGGWRVAAPPERPSTRVDTKSARVDAPARRAVRRAAQRKAGVQ